MEQTIKFIEENADGNGTDINVMVNVPEDVIDKLTRRNIVITDMLEKTIEEIKVTWDDWDTDTLISEACDRVFGPFNWSFVDAPFVVKF